MVGKSNFLFSHILRRDLVRGNGGLSDQGTHIQLAKLIIREVCTI